MVWVALLVGPVVALLAAAAVYADATRRLLSRRARLLWTLIVGFGGVCGFLVPYLFAGAFHRLYLRDLKPAPVAVSPFEILALHLAVGTAVCVGLSLVYGVGSRHGALRRT